MSLCNLSLKAITFVLLLSVFSQAQAQAYRVQVPVGVGGITIFVPSKPQVGGGFCPAVGNVANLGTASQQSNSSWSMSFKEERLIEQVTLVNRTDCCKENLRNITVSLENAAGEVVYTSRVLNPNNNLNGPSLLTVDLGDFYLASKVLVSTSANVELKMEDVEIQGCKELNSRPENFAGNVDGFGNVLLSWRKIHPSLRFQLQSREPTTNQWNTIYDGNNSTYLATNLEVGQKWFRVRACEVNSCGSYTAIRLNIDQVEETQCVPFVIDPAYR